MPWRRAVVWMLLLVFSGCASGRVARLETGGGRVLEDVPASWDTSIRVSEDEFEEALARLVLHVPLTLHPSQAGALVRASSTGATLDRAWQFTLRNKYGNWCGAHEAPSDCLSLLEDGLGFSSMDRLTVAVGLSLDPMRRSIAAAVEDTLSPHLFAALIATSMVSWVALAAAPEPVFTKAAAILAAVLLVYLGGESFLEVVRACAELKGAAERATTFQELEEAGARFGRVLGKEGARVFVLAVTVLVSKGTAGGSAWLASRMPLLPRYTESAALGARQLGVELASVGQVSAVAVGERAVALVLAPTAVAMVALGPGGGGSGPSSGGPGEWVQVNESMSESASRYQAQVTGAPKGYAYRVKKDGKEVDFDGFDSKEGVLLEAKGPNYQQFISAKLKFEKFFQGAGSMLQQARRQLEVAQGVPIRWVVAEKKLADALQKLFEFNRFRIEVVHAPPVP